MRGLFTKIFLFFWLAQSLTFVISIMLIVQHRFTRPEQTFDILGVALQAEGTGAANAFEQGGCNALRNYAASIQQRIVLSDATAQPACDVEEGASYGELLGRTEKSAGILSQQFGSSFAWATAVRSSSNRRYLFLVVRPFQGKSEGLLASLRRFAFPQLPVGIVVCGLTTFVLVLLLTRPIARLRAAARDLAGGKLTTRIARPEREVRIFGGDEIQGLVDDFNHMAERLESLVGAQKMLVRDVSHELRSPLARLSVALELAREEAPAGMHDHLQRIEREAGRLNLLIGQLLRLSAMESADSPLDAEEFSLNALLDEMLPDAQFEAQQRECRVDLQTSSICTIKGNSELLYRAIENVLRNAIRYSEQGTVIEMSLERAKQNGHAAAILRVSDRGPGIPENEIENVFRPFYRVDSARQRDTGGFGVGLAIAERAVRLHRGEVSAENRPGGGLTLCLSIPCEPDTRSETAQPE